jgi:hypothetical protein
MFMTQSALQAVAAGCVSDCSLTQASSRVQKQLSRHGYAFGGLTAMYQPRKVSLYNTGDAVIAGCTRATMAFWNT